MLSLLFSDLMNSSAGIEHGGSPSLVLHTEYFLHTR